MPTSPYFNAAGAPLPGVTTIIGRFKESGGLMFWAHKVGYDQGRAGKAPRLYEPRDIEADVGTYIHALIEWHIGGEHGERPAPAAKLGEDDRKRGVNGFEQFLHWQERTKLWIVSWEKPLVSERLQFGGTPDALFEFEGAISMGDWKGTGKVYPDNIIQLAAYTLLWEENYPDQPLRGAHVVRFSKDYGDVEHRQFTDLTVEKRQFARLRAAWDDDKLISARVK